MREAHGIEALLSQSEERASPEGKDYIHMIATHAAETKDEARGIDRGWQLVDQDLNESVGGFFIYLSFSKTASSSVSSNPVTNLLIVTSSEALQWETKVLKDGDGRSATYHRCDCDLNKGAGGRFVYLCYTFDRMYSPLVSITACSCDERGKNRPQSSNWEAVTWEGSKDIADTNAGAGGKYIHIFQKHDES